MGREAAEVRAGWAKRDTPPRLGTAGPGAHRPPHTPATFPYRAWGPLPPPRSTAGAQPRPHIPAGPQRLAFGQRARTPPCTRSAAVWQHRRPPCCRHPGPAPLGSAQLRKGLTEPRRVPRSPPFSHPPFLLASVSAGFWPPASALPGPVPALPVFPQIFTFSRLTAPRVPAYPRRSPAAAAAATAVAAAAARRDGAGPPHFPHPGFPALSRPHRSPTSGIGPSASEAPPSIAIIGYEVPKAPPSHVKRALATPRAMD